MKRLIKIEQKKKKWLSWGFLRTEKDVEEAGEIRSRTQKARRKWSLEINYGDKEAGFKMLCSVEKIWNSN